MEIETVILEMDSVADVTVSGGTTTITNTTIFGGYQGDGQVDMTGGILNLSALWIADQGDTLVNQSGGTINGTSMIMGRSNGSSTTSSLYNLSGSAIIDLSGAFTLGTTSNISTNTFTMDDVDVGAQITVSVTYIDGDGNTESTTIHMADAAERT